MMFERYRSTTLSRFDARRACGLTLGFVATLSAAREARSGNDDENLVGNDAAMAAGAVMATVSDASATWYNPAGLGRVKRTHIDASATVYALRFYRAPRFLQSTTGEGEDANVNEFVAVPSQIAYARELGHGFTLGLGYYVPQASSVLLRESFTTEQGDAESEIQVSIMDTHFVQCAGAALGFSLSPRVRLGFSAIGSYETETASASFAVVDRQGGVETDLAAIGTLATFWRLGIEMGIGFQIEATPRWTVSLTARTPRVFVAESYDSSQSSAAATAAGFLDASLAEPKGAEEGFHLTRSGRAGAGVAFEPERGTFVAFEVDVQPGIHDESLDVNRKAVVNVRAGGIYRVSDVVSLGTGLFTDRSPSASLGDDLTSRGDFYGGTAGIELRDRHRLGRGEPSDEIVLSTTLAVRYAYSSGSINGIVIEPGSAAASLDLTQGRLVTHEASLYFGGGVNF
jgi:hypothetical protein